jgi:hypothetical protein
MHLGLVCFETLESYFIKSIMVGVVSDDKAAMVYATASLITNQREEKYRKLPIICMHRVD